MTKARGAFDSIGKAGRGASFLLPAFSPYYAPYFPLFLCTYVQHCTQMHTSTHVRIVYMCNILCPEKHTFTRVLLFFPAFFASITFHSFFLYLLYLSLSLSLSYLFLFPYVLNTFDVYMALSVRLSASSLFYHLNYYTRFHVMWLYAFAVRGQLYTWVNGKMSFETFLGRSRSPHCQSYTRDSAWGS